MNDSKLLFKRMGTIVESTRSRTRLMQQADACITLPLRGFGMMDFLELAPLIEQGYAGSIAPLQEWIGKSGMAAAYGQATDLESRAS